MAKLNDKTMRENGVYFHLDNSRVRELPDHIEQFKTALLDFQYTLVTQLNLEKDPGPHQIHRTLDKLCSSARERGQIQTQLRHYQKVAAEATRISERNSREPEWQNLYRSMLLNPLYERMRATKLDSRCTSRTKFYYDSFERSEQDPWIIFSEQGPFNKRRRNLTYPKPDWAAYFPIYDFEEGPCRGIAGPSGWNWAGQQDIVAQFSRERLAYLTDSGLECHVSGALRRGRKPDPSLADMFSFPWLVVEHKRNEHGSNARQCYRQAANAAACVLLMFEKLCKYCEKRPDEAQIPPVVTMTTVGKETRVWIGYVARRKDDEDEDATEDETEDEEDEDKDEEPYNELHTQCVWTGDTTQLVDVVKLDALLENLHTWAMRVLRPQISFYLDQWSQKTEERAQQPPIRTKRRVDILEYARYGFEDAEVRLRSIMAAYHGGTLQKIEELLSAHLSKQARSVETDSSSKERAIRVTE